MKTTYTASPDARDNLRAAVRRWVLAHVVPALAERGLPEAAAVAPVVTSTDMTDGQRWTAVDQLLATVRSWRDRELIGTIASILGGPWTLNAPASLPDALIMRLGLRQVVTLARADEAVLAELVANHPRIAAMDTAMDAIKLAQNEIAGIDWSPEAQRLAWAATKPAEAAGLSVTIDTCPDGLRLMIIDNDDDKVLLNVPYRGGVDQDGYRVRDVDLRPTIAEILALDAALPHDRDAVWPDGVSKRREELYVRAWYMARAAKWRYQDHAAGWQVGVDHDPTDPKRPVVAVIVLPSGVQLRGHVRRGVLPEKGADVIPWDGRPRDLAGIAAWLVQG